MDEKGVILGYIGSESVIICTLNTSADRQRRQAGNRDFSILMECVSAAGAKTRVGVILCGSSRAVAIAVREFII